MYDKIHYKLKKKKVKKKDRFLHVFSYLFLLMIHKPQGITFISFCRLPFFPTALYIFSFVLDTWRPSSFI